MLTGHSMSMLNSWDAEEVREKAFDVPSSFQHLESTSDPLDLGPSVRQTGLQYQIGIKPVVLVFDFPLDQLVLSQPVLHLAKPSQ